MNPIGTFPTAQGCLLVGGVPLPRLAERVGQTPFFAYDRQRLTRRVAELRAALPEDVGIRYCLKANPMPALVQHLAGLVDGFDVASAGEMKIALDAPVRPDRVGFAGPGKDVAELRRAIAAGVVIHLESEHEAERVGALGRQLAVTPKVAVRVNPPFDLRGAGMRMGGGAKPFGIDAERVPAVLENLAGQGLAFHGFHLFSGSQALDAEMLTETFGKTALLLAELAAVAPVPPTTIDLGGGLGIPYFDGDRALDLGQLRLAEALRPLRRACPAASLVLELGRFLVGEAGIYVTRVLERKVSRGKVFLVTDGGLHHHLAASGNFGTKIRRNFPVAIGNRMDRAPEEEISVVGRLCTPLDLLADRVMLPRAEPGDLVVVFQSGAYGLTASPSAFLGHPPAAEVLL